MNRRAVLLAATLAFVALIPNAHAAASVAVITDISGKATVQEGTKATPATVLAYLPAGAGLALEPGAQLTITFFAKPVAFTLAGPARGTVISDGITISSGKAAQSRPLATAAVTAAQKFEPEKRERVAVAAVEMRVPRPVFKIITPAGARVLSTTPELRWVNMAGADYQVTLSEVSGKVVLEQTTRDASFTIAEPLRRGGGYALRVAAKPAKGETQVAQTTFEVATAKDAQLFDAAKPKTGAGFTEHVLYAAQLDGSGYRSEAVRVWQSLAAERPDDETLQALAREGR